MFETLRFFLRLLRFLTFLLEIFKIYFEVFSNKVTRSSFELFAPRISPSFGAVFRFFAIFLCDFSENLCGLRLYFNFHFSVLLIFPPFYRLEFAA